MNSSRPSFRPVFQRPGQQPPEPGPAADENTERDPGRDRCELDRCDAEVAEAAGRDNVRYCSPAHRKAAHLLRRRQRYDSGR